MQRKQEQALARALLKRKEERQQPRSSEARSTSFHEPAARGDGGDGNGQVGGMKLPKIGARVSDVGGARAHGQGPSSLLDKTGGSQIPKEGVALVPLVPPVLKKWALEKEKVENRGGL